MPSTIPKTSGARSAAPCARRAQTAGVAPEAIAGISFDATCSLVVRDARRRPASASRRAARIAGTRSSGSTIARSPRPTNAPRPATACSTIVGGVMSPEMADAEADVAEAPPAATAGTQAGYIFDLTDFLTWKATGSLARSQCTLTCKWTYLAHERRLAARLLRAASGSTTCSSAAACRSAPARSAPISAR